jgi:hypothetical protein
MKPLQIKQIDIVKPFFDNADGLRPDFVLPKEKMLIEVQGMSSDEYREHKMRIHKQMIESQQYRRFKLITYDANRRENIAVFGRRLLSYI